MKRRIFLMLLVVVMLFSASTQAYAATQAVTVTPTLTFSGTTATCKVNIYKYGKSINATLELWRGNTLIASWSDTATSHLLISETKTVVKGQTYTLKVSGTIGGVSFTGTSVTKTC